MSPNKTINQTRAAMLNAMWSLPFWEGHVVDSVLEQEDGSLLIALKESPGADALCGCCRQPCALIHERRRRRVRDRDILDRRVWLDVPIKRLDCHHCDALAEFQRAEFAPDRAAFPRHLFVSF